MAIRVQPGDVILGLGKVRVYIRHADIARRRANPDENLTPEEKRRRDREAIQAALSVARYEGEDQAQVEGQVEGQATGEKPQRCGIPKQSSTMEIPASEPPNLGEMPEEEALEPMIVGGHEAQLLRMIRKYDIDPDLFLECINNVLDSPHAHVLLSDD